MASEQGELENVHLFIEVIKSSLGPNALSKLVVNAEDGKILPSNRVYELFFSTPHDGSSGGNKRKEQNTNAQNTLQQPQQSRTTITTMVAVLLKAQQYMLNKYKDGSTSVVLLAATFLELGFKLHAEGISRNKISEIYQKGLLSAVAVLDMMPTKKIVINWSSISQALPVIRMLLGTKLAPMRESSALSTLLADSICTAVDLSLKRNGAQTSIANTVDSIRLCTCVGGDVNSSSKVTGLVIPYLPVSVQKSISSKIHIAFFAVPLLERHTKVNLVANLTTPYVLKQWQKEEEQILKDTALRIVETRANVVFSSGSVHKYILHWLDLHGVIVVPSIPKSELISIAEATGGKLIYQKSFFDNSDLGTAYSFEILHVSGENYSVVNAPHTLSLLLKGPTRHKTNQVLKYCRDALAVVRSMKLSSDGSALLGEVEVICGGGAPEMIALTQLPVTRIKGNINDDNYLAQYILSTFASGFGIIPKCLLENSGAPNEAFQVLKELHEQGRNNSGISKTGNIEEFNLDQTAVFDFVDVKKQVWSVAADVASLLLLVNDSVVGNPLH